MITEKQLQAMENRAASHADVPILIAEVRRLQAEAARDRKWAAVKLAQADEEIDQLRAQVNASQRQQQYIAGIIESEGKYVP